jgi:hypothetical protein
MASATEMAIFTRTGTALELNGGATAIHAPVRTRAKKNPASRVGVDVDDHVAQVSRSGRARTAPG